MPEEPSQYDIAARIGFIQSLGRKQYGDGLRMVRLIGPDLNPTYNDQIGVAKCQTTEVLVCESNRGSKSFTAACRFASIARDVPLTTWDGEQIECRPKHHRDRPLTLWLIGYGLSHIGQTMYRLLFEEGQFQMIQDPVTHAWRTFRPWEKWDQENSRKTKPGPPLIPPHEIDQKSWVWENKGDNQFIKVKLNNGTQLLAYPSSGEVKKGDPVHGIWADEMIKYSQYYPEWIMRLTDYEGWLMWSTMIYRNCSALNNRMEAADRQREEVERGDRDPKKVITSLFRFKQGGNPYLNQKRVEEVNREIIGDFGDDEVKQRIDGGSIFDSTLIYPYFDKKFHSAIPDNEKEWDNLSRVLHALQGLPPDDWTHDLIIDPGAQKPAVLFCAVPPREWADAQGKVWNLWGAHAKPYFVPYDEIYGQRYSLKQLVPIIKQKMRGIRFRRFIIDMQAGQQTPLVGGPPVKSLYSSEFEAHGLESEETGINFIAGDKNFQSRSRIVDGWMQSLQSGKPQLRIVTQRCPNLVRQLSNNQRRMVGDVVLDEEEKRERNDLRVCFDKETEVLTEFGWKLFSDLSGSEKLGTLNLDNSHLEFQVPSRLVKNYHHGEMIRFAGHKLNAMVTPDHRMLSFPQGEHVVSEFRQACDLRTQDSLRMFCGKWGGMDHECILVPHQRRGRELEKEIDPGDLAEFLGWYVSEGCKSPPRCPGWGYRVLISQVKQDGCRMLESLLNLLPWKYRRDGQSYSISSKQLWCYIDSLAIGDRCWNKRVPQWVKDAHPRIIHRFLTGYVLGDGWVDGRKYRSVTTSKLLADDIQELYLKIGKSASVRIRDTDGWSIGGRSGSNTRRAYVTSELTLPRAGLYSHNSVRNFSEVQYDDFVYCATVPNGTLVVRREGSPLVAGNCVEYWASRNPKYVPIQHKSTAEPWVRAQSKKLEQLFGQAKEQNNRCHFGPGVAPTGAA